jgi:hypothetical protein
MIRRWGADTRRPPIVTTAPSGMSEAAWARGIELLTSKLHFAVSCSMIAL